jgi:hypothetical protein
MEPLVQAWQWYIAPWRRIGRPAFGTALAVASIPTLLFMLLGWADLGSSWLSPFGSLTGLSDLSNPQNLESNLGALNGLGAGALPSIPGLTTLPEALGGAAATPPPAPVAPIAPIAPVTPPAAPTHYLATLGAILTNLSQLLLIPLCRMRLLDMGHPPRRALVLSVIISLSSLSNLLAAVGLPQLPASTLLAILNFLGYFWLCVAGSAAHVPIHQRNLPPL